MTGASAVTIGAPAGQPRPWRRAAATIAEAQARGTELVCCALGYSRSAAAVATWLLASGRAATIDEAVAELRRVRPRIVLDEAARAAIAVAAARGPQA